MEKLRDLCISYMYVAEELWSLCWTHTWTWVHFYQPNPTHQTHVIMTKIYISFVFIQASLRHIIQLAANVMHERLFPNEHEETVEVKEAIATTCSLCSSEHVSGAERPNLPLIAQLHLRESRSRLRSAHLTFW